ncbi:MAG: ABC transporter ATP-binding protein, partial [Anaerolineae bacterium]|nr:ABC transporter ATP-binding protein [Anaerolineae bacterium]
MRVTLARLWQQYTGRRLVLLGVLFLAIFSAWAQVITPDLIGQTVDCYLMPYSQQEIGGFGDISKSAQSNCWYTDNTNLSRSETVAGVRGVILLLVALFFVSSLTTGFQFYLMRWTGLRVLRDLRVKVFAHIHRLSLSYYTKNEAGDVMSRLTNDMDTLQQTISFALVQVMRGSLLIVWLIYAMFSRSVPFAL